MTLLVSNSRSFPCNLSERHNFFISISVPWFLVFLQLGCRSIKIQSKSTTNDRQPGDGCLEPYSLNYASFGVGWIRNGREIMQGIGSSQSNLSFRSNILTYLCWPLETYSFFKQAIVSHLKNESLHRQQTLTSIYCYLHPHKAFTALIFQLALIYRLQTTNGRVKNHWPAAKQQRFSMLSNFWVQR